MMYFPASLVWAMVLGAVSVTTSSQQSKTKLYENSAKIVPSFLLSSNKVKGRERIDDINQNDKNAKNILLLYLKLKPPN